MFFQTYKLDSRVI